MTAPTPRAPRRNTDPCAEAFRRGHRAAIRGEGRDSCPFVEGSGRPTWTRSYRLAWQRGFDMGRAAADQEVDRRLEERGLEETDRLDEPSGDEEDPRPEGGRVKPGLQPIVRPVYRKDSDFIEASVLRCGCVAPFTSQVAQAQRRNAVYRQCRRHPNGPGGKGAMVARRLGVFQRRVQRKPPRPAPPPPPEGFEELQRQRHREGIASLNRDRDRLLKQTRETESVGLAQALSAALRAAVHPCGHPEHAAAMLELERGLRVAGRIR